MKKTVTKLFALVFALFASQNIMAQSELLLDEPFQGSMGAFKVEGPNGSNGEIWTASSDYVAADAYGTIGDYEEVVNYLVSPEINLGSDGTASFDFYWRYFSTPETDFGFSVREVGGVWQDLEFDKGESINWNAAQFVIPETFNGKKIQVGFKYSTSGSKDSGQYHIKNLKVYGVKGSDADAQISSDLYYGESEVSYAMGSGDFEAPVLDNPYGVEVNYESSDVNVASVDAQGVVTINGVGVTTIKATSVETPKYYSTTASYVLTVTEAVETNIVFEEPFTKSLGEFVVEGFNGIDPIGNPVWGFEGFAKADAYDKMIEPFVNYLVSPVIKLSNEETVAHFIHSVDYFVDVTNETGFCIRTVNGVWKTLEIAYPSNPGEAISSGNVVIPAEYLGKEVQFGFKYSAESNQNAGIWSIQQFVVEKTGGSSEKVDPAISYDVTDVYYILESDFTEPVLNNPNNVTVNYSSSDNTIATVDATTGEVTAVAEGTVTITATAPESDKYLAGEASYTITVTAPAVTEVIFSETFEASLGKFTIEGDNNGIWAHDVAFATADGYGKISGPVESYLVSPVITLGDASHIVHYAQSQDYFNSFAKETSFVVRTVGGEWTKLVQPNIPTKGNWSETGNIKIPEEFRGKDVQFAFRYSAQTSNSAGLWSVSDFVVEKVCNGTEPKISYSTLNAVAFIGQEFTAPELNNPYGVEVTFASSNPEVAEVDAQTGAVTVIAQGTTTITATSVATETFVSGTASYELTVNAPSAEDIVFEAYFDENLCGFTVEGFNGVEMPIWKQKNGTARADAFTKVSGPTANYLVSPVIKMNEKGNKAEFNYKFLHDANSKTPVEDEFGFVIREVGGDWTTLVIPNVNGNNEMVSSGSIEIPEAFDGKKVQIAFMYFAESGSTSGVLSIDDIVIRKHVPTCIEGITAEELENAVIYDLQGRRVDQLGKGVYIVNGKKLVIK